LVPVGRYPETVQGSSSIRYRQRGFQSERGDDKEMASKKIKISGELLDKASRIAEIAGYASVEEFILHVIEKEIAKMDEGDDSIEEVEKRLKGLGYIT
jgi:hypothetical protein